VIDAVSYHRAIECAAAVGHAPKPSPESNCKEQLPGYLCEYNYLREQCALAV